jgi:S-adenosylmethionine/arginine decarboxylase-like enzyme
MPMHLDAGRLVALNVQVSDPARLAEPQFVEEFLRVLIARIGMKPLTEPMSVLVEPSLESVGDAHADDGGLTTQCIISTSHVAYHSWPLQERFRLVVDSCKDFSPDAVRQMVDETFPVKALSIQDIGYARPEQIDGTKARPQASTAPD